VSKTILKSATNTDSDSPGKVYLCFDNQFSIAPSFRAGNEESLKLRALALHMAVY